MITLIAQLESHQGFDTARHGESSILVMKQVFFSEWFFNLSSEFNFVGIGSMVVCPQFHKFQHCLVITFVEVFLGCLENRCTFAINRVGRV